MWKFFYRTYLLHVIVIIILWAKFGPGLMDSLEDKGIVTRKGKIAFSSNRDGNWEIYVMNPDGSSLRRRTQTRDIDETCPVWSPDGRQIAFVSANGEDSNIETIRSNGRNRLALTENPAKDTDPCWSPDGTRIAFASYRNGHGDIYVMDADGFNMRKLTEHNADDYSPMWHPNGNRIFFIRNLPIKKKTLCHLEKVYAVDPDGGSAVDVSREYPSLGNAPCWDKKGKMVAFSGSMDITRKRGVIYMMRWGNRFLKQLTYRGDEEFDDNPTWSPDGNSIAFSRRVLYRRKPTDIYVVDVQDGEVTNLTKGIGDNDYPDWY